MQPYSDDLSMVFEEAAGQEEGGKIIALLLLPTLKNSGYHLFSCSEYMSRIRGGSNTTELRITGPKRQAYTACIDLLFFLSLFRSMRHLWQECSPVMLSRRN